LHHEWQIMTYAWLRSQQSSAKPIVAGILFYFNELVPSQQDMALLKEDTQNNTTDIMPTGLDLTNISSWQRRQSPPALSSPFKELRSIRVIPISPQSIQNSLNNFDSTVNEIEQSVRLETTGHRINTCWNTIAEPRTCTACDWKTSCPNPSVNYIPTVP
jgi:hypothetical protein